MGRHSRAEHEIAVDFAHLASAPDTPQSQAAAILDALEELLPFQAGAVCLLDAERGEGAVLAQRGFDHAVASYIGTKTGFQEAESLGFTRHRRAMRLQDLEVTAGQIRGWTDYLEPAGFRGGMAVGLFTLDGHAFGLVVLATVIEGQQTEADRDLLGRLAPAIAAAVDPMRTVRTVARLVDGAEAAILLELTGRIVGVPGLPGHVLLAAHSPALAVATKLVEEGTRHAEFLVPHAVDGGVEHARVTVLSCPTFPYAEAALVALSPAGDVRGLTRRELEVLGLIIEGWSNQRIAASIVVAERTVAAHIEHILAKLGVPTRTLAAVQAIRTGLYVPLGLSPLR